MDFFGFFERSPLGVAQAKKNQKKCPPSSILLFFFDKIIGVMTMNSNNDNEFNTISGSNLTSAHELISTYGMEALPQAMEVLFNEAMLIERAQHLGAGHYQRSDNRIDYANGFKPKRVKTRIGALDLAVPQTRESDFYPNCLEKGLRSERALNIALGEMYVGGVSTRKVSKIIESMCGTSVSSTMVSNAAKKLDEALSTWRQRPLGKIDYLIVDARYEKVRVDGLVRDCAVLIALGIDDKGKREVLGVKVSLSEAEVHWREFFSTLQKRGMFGVKLLISDAHSGIKAARKAVMPSVPWQRCQFHLQQNAQAYVSKRSKKKEVALDIRNIFNAPNADEAKRQLDLFIDKYNQTMPDLSKWAEDNIYQSLTVFGLNLSEFNRKRLRTSNIIERLNQSVKQRTRVAKIFANKESCLRLVTAVAMEISDEWQSSKAYLSVDGD
jgi:transposase-like protein